MPVTKAIPLTTKGDVLTTDGTVPQRLGVGANDTVLTADSGEATGVKWAAASASQITTSLTAAHDVSAGDLVGTGFVADTCGGANYRFKEVATGLTTTGEITRENIKPVGGDKFVIMGQDTGGNLDFVVGTVNRATATITFGTPVAAATDFAYAGGDDLAAFCKLDTDRFIAFYMDTGSTTVIRYRVGSITGSAISFGTEGNVVTGGSAVEHMTACFISADKCVLGYKCLTETDGRVIAMTVSGDTATPGTAVGIGTTIDGTSIWSSIAIATDKFVLFDAIRAYAQVGSLSGTAITMGSEQSQGTDHGGDSDRSAVISPDTDVFITVRDGTGTNDIAVVANTVSGETITAGTELTVDAGTPACMFLTATDATTYWISKYSATQRFLTKVTRSGTVLTEVTSGSFIGQISPSISIDMDNGYWVSCYVQGDEQLDYFIEGMSGNFIGIAQSSVSRTASVSVLVAGVDSNQSGLVPGSEYKISNGSLTPISPSINLTTTDSLPKLRAISETKIVV